MTTVLTRAQLFACARFLTLVLVCTSAPTVHSAPLQQQELPPDVPPVAEWLPDRIKALFTPEAILQREQDAAAGKIQSNEQWMWPGAAYLLLSPSNPTGPGGTKTKIASPAHLMANNNISFYRYPWQAWEETVPASRIRDGLGINLNLSDSQLPAGISQLKAMGVTKWRTDIGWGAVDSRTLQLNAAFKQRLATRIALCRQAGLRPLFCLDTNPAAPCPINEASVELLAPLKAGDTSALIKPRPGEVPAAWTSGLSHVTQYWAAEYLTTRVQNEGQGYRVWFAKPWPTGQDKSAHDTLPYAYLGYRPFGNDNSAEMERTYQGFLSFVQTVQDFLETQGLRTSATDPGYDIEFLNENSNGHFFHLDWYAPGQATGDGSEMALYKRVVQQLRSNPANDEMTLINGFYNQLPPQPGSKEYAGSSGGSSHFYQAAIVEHARRGNVEDAFGRDNANGFIPDVVMHSPETVFSAYKPETLSRVISPIPQELWGSVYGRGVQPRTGKGTSSDPIALEPTGKPARPTHWYKTEWGDGQWGPEDERRYRIAKYVLRGTVFALSKGLERIYWFAAADQSLGLLSFDSQQLPSQEPMPVTILKRLNTVIEEGTITRSRQMPCVLIHENHGHVQFHGDGSMAYPDLPNRDILFTQSFQISDTDLMACVYVPTLNYEPDLPEETYTIRWSGVKWTDTSRATYQDLRDSKRRLIKPSAVGEGWVEFTLPVCDWPRFLKLSGV